MLTLTTPNWPDYQLLDSGDGLRLESFAGVTTVRPDPNVLWPKTKPQDAAWQLPDARYLGQKEQPWQLNSPNLAHGWKLKHERATFVIKPTPFRHMGIFPEQAGLWQWLVTKVKPGASVLNLFAYTGGASVSLALAGAKVTHVDASAGSLNWAKENARASGLTPDAIRWLQDDVPKFLRREVRRGSHYDAILMDPPVFGRGPKGEIFRLEEQLPELFDLVRQLQSSNSQTFLCNFYATATYPEAILRLGETALDRPLELGSLCLEEKYSGKQLPTGFFLRS